VGRIIAGPRTMFAIRMEFFGRDRGVADRDNCAVAKAPCRCCVSPRTLPAETAKVRERR